MRANPESSASTLPRKLSKCSAAVAPADAESEASGIEGDWRYMWRDVIGSSVKNMHMPVKKMGIATMIRCILIVMMRMA